MFRPAIQVYVDIYLRNIDPSNPPWRVTAEQSGGGIFLDLGCHALDIFDFLLGPIESVRGISANIASPYDVEDAVALSCRFTSGALGVCSWNFADAAREDQIKITGTKGEVTLSVFGNEPLRLETAAGVEQFDLPNPPHIQQPLIQSIVDQLCGQGQCPSTGTTAARTARVMDQVLESYYGGRDDSFWIRPETWPGRRG